MNHHSQILSLARAGNPGRAWERFVELGLDSAEGEIKTLTLKGRLLKDRGDRAQGDERLRLYADASRAYLAANDLKTDSYPLINAATLSLLSRDAVRTVQLAEQVLDLIKSDPNEGETPYWREATRAEALLLLGRIHDAQAALEKGIAMLPRAWEDHAATIGQFERILAAQGKETDWLDAHRPAPAVYFSGLIGLDPYAPGLREAIREKLADLSPGFAYGALAAGADILIAEAMVEAGVLLHVVLPFSQERFREMSVEPYGADWPARFDALIERAETVEELWDADGEEASRLEPLIEAAGLVAMGQALRRAETLRTRSHALTVKALEEDQRGYLTRWVSAGLPLHVVETTRVSGAAGRSDGRPQVLASLAAVGLPVGAPIAMPNLKHDAGGDAAHWSGTVSDCLAAALTLQAAYPDASLGMIACPVASIAKLENCAFLAARLALSARSGELYSDHRSAMIAKVLSPESRVEQMGEIGSMTGPITVCAITPGKR